MNIRKYLIILMTVFFVLAISACSQKFNLKTPIGSFDMTVDIADQYEHSVPQEGNQFLVVHLTPQQSGITEQQMQQYIFPNGESKGAIAECEEGEYTLSSLRFEPGENGPNCIIIFEVPKELTDTAAIRLKLPNEEPKAS